MATILTDPSTGIPSSDEQQLQKIDSLAVASSPVTGSLAALVNALQSNIGTTSDAANASGSVLARLAELLVNRLTSARAGNLDRLDATISSRASGTDYTAARAAKLDNLDAAISSVLNRLDGGTPNVIVNSYTVPANSNLTVVNISGSGILDFVWCQNNISYVNIKITLDGNIVYNSITPSATNTYAIPIVRGLKFNSSLSIILINNNANQQTVNGICVQYRTGV
jgi:hypothetical protein